TSGARAGSDPIGWSVATPSEVVRSVVSGGFAPRARQTVRREGAMSSRDGTHWDRFVDKARRAWRERGLPPLSARRSARQIPAALDAESPVLVVSPHLDDAVLSAFALLQDRRSTVLSVFTGSPEGDEPSHWD